MPTIEEIADRQARGYLVHADMVDKAIVLESKGGDYPSWGKVYGLWTTLAAMDGRVLAEDYTSADTVRLYKLLDCFIGSQFISGASLDPNSQQEPGVVYVGNQPAEAGYSFDKIFFTNQTLVTISNYHELYYPLFGNGPNLAIYISVSDPDTGAITYNKDQGTTEDITYQNSDPSQNITSIQWVYPTLTSGYILISGKKPSI